MKNILLLVTIIIAIACKAQTVPLNSNYWEYPQGTYIKDTFNEMDKFVGTWQYNNGTDILTIVLQKKIHVYDGEYYFDMLIGEYQYTNNGIEIVNTLSLLNNSNYPINEHYIGGEYIINNDSYPPCINCINNEKRFKLGFGDPERNYLSLSLVLRYLTPNIGEPIKMTATLISNGGGIIPEENSPTNPRVPYGEYLMIKQ